MAGQTQLLIEALKRSLKANGKTYADVASALGLSQASVKRLLTSHQLSLTRLDQICQMMSMEMSELFKQAEEHSGKIEHLTQSQEQEICNDLVLLLITVCVLNRWSLKDITDQYQIDVHTCIQKLAHLDRLKLIDLLPKNHIKLKVAANFDWLENGPIQKFFQRHIANEFFKSQFKAEDEQLIVVNGMLSKSSKQAFLRKLRRLAREFEDLNREDVALSFEERKGATVVLAMRGWNYELFQPFLKNP